MSIYFSYSTASGEHRHLFLPTTAPFGDGEATLVGSADGRVAAVRFHRPGAWASGGGYRRRIEREQHFDGVAEAIEFLLAAGVPGSELYAAEEPCVGGHRDALRGLLEPLGIRLEPRRGSSKLAVVHRTPGLVNGIRIDSDDFLGPGHLASRVFTALGVYEAVAREIGLPPGVARRHALLMEQEGAGRLIPPGGVSLPLGDGRYIAMRRAYRREGGFARVLEIHQDGPWYHESSYWPIPEGALVLNGQAPSGNTYSVLPTEDGVAEWLAWNGAAGAPMVPKYLDSAGYLDFDGRFSTESRIALPLADGGGVVVSDVLWNLRSTVGRCQARVYAPDGTLARTDFIEAKKASNNPRAVYDYLVRIGARVDLHFDAIVEEEHYLSITPRTSTDQAARKEQVWALFEMAGRDCSDLAAIEVGQYL